MARRNDAAVNIKLEIRIVYCRPYRMFKFDPHKLPPNANRTVQETMVSIWTVLRSSARCIGGVAPDMTPVSYPNRKPPMAASMVRSLIFRATVSFLSSLLVTLLVLLMLTFSSSSSWKCSVEERDEDGSDMEVEDMRWLNCSLSFGLELLLSFEVVFSISTL